MSPSEPGSNSRVYVAILLANVALVALIAWRAFDIQPFDGDNLWVLEWADKTDLSGLAAVAPSVYPEWRPLPYATIWLQYKSATIEQLWAYQLVNLSIWVACGWIVARIVLDLSGSALAAFAGGLIVLTSTQLVSTFVVIVERQNSMACFFGLAAWLALIHAWKELSVWRWVGVSLLLAASAFSKEFGLAFAAAIGVFALVERHWPALWAAAGAVALYGVCRMVFAGGGIGLYCEQHGYFFEARNICFDRVDGLVISQAAYNVVATGISSLLPGLFFDDGTISVSLRWLLISAGILAVAAVGWSRGPRLNRIGLLIIACNTVLSVLLYRPRNQAVAVCALGVATGVGLPSVWATTQRTTPWRLVQAAILAIFVAALGTRVFVMRTLVADRVEMTKRPSACGPDVPDLDRAFLERVWRRYNLTLPECAGDKRIR